MPSDVHVSCHAEERFRARCAEGGPWPEFDIPQLKEWIADMVRANALDARYYYTPRGTAESIVVPLREEGVLLAVAICTKAWHRPPIVAVKTVYGPDLTVFAIVLGQTLALDHSFHNQSSLKLLIGT